MSEQDAKITVENVIDSAIVHGFKNVSALYMENLEEGLKRNVIINEAGTAQSMLQEMIDQTEAGAVQQESAAQLDELDQKMSRLLSRSAE